MTEVTINQQVAGLRVFDGLVHGEPAPAWLHTAMCVAFGLDGRITSRLISVSENASYLVADDNGPLGVIRLQQPGYHEGPAQVESEMAWVCAVREAGCAEVPSPIPGADGRLAPSIAMPGGEELSAVMFEHVAGSILQEDEDPALWYGELGRITARLHEHSRNWVAPIGFHRFRWGLPELLGASARWGDWRGASLTRDELALLERAETTAVEIVQHAPAAPEDWGLIHSDLRPTNVIRDDDRLVVIDFDDSGFSWYLYDLAAALTFQEHRPQARAMASNWIDGYRTVAELSDPALEVGCALSMVRTLTMLGWSTTHRNEALPADLQEGGVVEATLCVAERFRGSTTWLLET